MGRRWGEGSEQVAVWVRGCWPRPTHSRPTLQRNVDSQFEWKSKHSQIPHSHGIVWRDYIILRNTKADKVMSTGWNHWSALYDLLQQVSFSVKVFVETLSFQSKVHWSWWKASSYQVAALNECLTVPIPLSPSQPETRSCERMKPKGPSSCGGLWLIIRGKECRQAT